MSAASSSADVVVLGAGPAGYVSAIRLSQLGKKVTVIDRDGLGGVCLNRGCIPSKALIYAGTLFEKMNHASEMGINVKGASVDLPKLIAWKETVVKKLTDGVGGLLKAHGCEVLKGEAKFTSAKTLEFKPLEGGPARQISFQTCVIATGSRPMKLPGFEIDHESILDSTSALEEKKLPERLLCVGGGYISLELGTFFSKIGSAVTVLEASPRLLGSVDPALVQVVEKGLVKRGVKIHVGAKAKSWKKTPKGIEVSFEKDGKTETVLVDKVLVSIGRVPNTDSIGIEKTGIQIDRQGFIPVDPKRATKVAGLFAIGDVAGQPLLAHKGSKEGLIAAEVIAGKKSAYDVVAMPAVVFTDPEIATVGMTEAEAREKGIDVLVGQFPFAANGRALSVLEPDGFVKLVGDKKTGRLLGAHIVGAEASNLIAEATLALEMGAMVEDLALTVHAHPTLPETMMEAAEAAMGHAVHIFQKKPATPAKSAESRA